MSRRKVFKTIMRRVDSYRSCTMSKGEYYGVCELVVLVIEDIAKFMWEDHAWLPNFLQRQSPNGMALGYGLIYCTARDDGSIVVTYNANEEQQFRISKMEELRKHIKDILHERN